MRNQLDTEWYKLALRAQSANQRQNRPARVQITIIVNADNEPIWYEVDCKRGEPARSNKLIELIEKGNGGDEAGLLK